jgi:hypothetical protein
MKVDLTFRIIVRSSGRLLRIRFRREDGQSAVLLFSDPEKFRASIDQANLAPVAVSVLEGDLLVVAQMQETTYFRRAIELSSEELNRLSATDWRDPQRFDLSFEKAHEGQLRLKAREVDPYPGIMSLNVQIDFPKEHFGEVIRPLGLQPREVRDLNLHGSQSARRISEDEVEAIFDSIHHESA